VLQDKTQEIMPRLFQARNAMGNSGEQAGESAHNSWGSEGKNCRDKSGNEPKKGK
jgi:hypothetical protein